MSKSRLILAAEFGEPGQTSYRGVAYTIRPELEEQWKAKGVDIHAEIQAGIDAAYFSGEDPQDSLPDAV